MPTITWYRMAGARRFHLAGETWIRSGKAACGARLDRPGFAVDLRAGDAWYPGLYPQCAHCKRAK